ncbi:2'-5' RNA ligase [Kineococcus xinjiangensis]|uniref:2'-5' RNA ligase n=1 Tax=Kineococcus xinjiangensis TaxID=512762 RepID=A0A2S6ITT2_9ACTN|nr:2'-5' RNA ligase family protein [Kineococcus xinjiangensis]PPK97664.1 2'-5' RNA ligase [Kineococcus xinjiangensis]
MSAAGPSAGGEEVGTIGIAVPVPAPYDAELTRWRSDFGDPLADRIPPHVTLLPPTVLPLAELDVVRAHLRAVAAAAQPFPMHLRGTATFRPVSPVVFVQVARGISECELLEAAVRGGPLHRELAFPYHPHVTVAHDVDEASLDRAERTLRDWEATFTVTGFCLYEHGEDGVWRPREEFTFPLAPGG